MRMEAYQYSRRYLRECRVTSIRNKKDMLNFFVPVSPNADVSVSGWASWHWHDFVGLSFFVPVSSCRLLYSILLHPSCNPTNRSALLSGCPEVHGARREKRARTCLSISAALAAYCPLPCMTKHDRAWVPLAQVWVHHPAWKVRLVGQLRYPPTSGPKVSGALQELSVQGSFV